jgi:hypothetical protein
MGRDSIFYEWPEGEVSGEEKCPPHKRRPAKAGNPQYTETRSADEMMGTTSLSSYHHHLISSHDYS